MKKVILILLTLVISSSLIFIACNKKDVTKMSPSVSNHLGIQSTKDFEKLYSDANKKFQKNATKSVFAKISKETFIVLRDNLVFDNLGNFHGLGKGLHRLEKELTKRELEQFFGILIGMKASIAPKDFKMPSDCGCSEQEISKMKSDHTNNWTECSSIIILDYRWVQYLNCKAYYDATCYLYSCGGGPYNKIKK